MSSPSLPELLIALCAVAVGVSAVRALRPSARSRPQLPVTAELRSHLRMLVMLVMQGKEDEAVSGDRLAHP